jgi:dihydroorotate dehydrogenase electron transfer subunit
MPPNSLKPLNSFMTSTHIPIHATAAVISQREVAHRHYRLKIHAPEIARQAKAGQFVHVLSRSDISSDPLLRRAFSILSIQEDAIEILYRVEGRGTALMAKWTEGDQVDLIGPIGNGFAPLPEAPGRALLVGGGVGVPPMAMLASTKRNNQSVTALTGARSINEVICLEDFAEHDVPVHIATDDGSAGHHGFVTELLNAELEQGRDASIFACGPLPMLRAVAALCEKFDTRCQLSLEENMPCGVGVCNGCVVAVNGAGDDYGRYRRICVEGPVLWGHEIDWSRYEGGGCP